MRCLFLFFCLCLCGRKRRRRRRRIFEEFLKKKEKIEFLCVYEHYFCQSQYKGKEKRTNECDRTNDIFLTTTMTTTTTTTTTTLGDEGEKMQMIEKKIKRKKKKTSPVVKVVVLLMVLACTTTLTTRIPIFSFEEKRTSTSLYAFASSVPSTKVGEE